MLLNCWRRLLRVPWAARSNQSILKEIKPVNPKGNQSWIFFRRTDAEAEALILWLRDAKCWHIGKDWFWESLKAGEEGDNRGQNGWTASLSQWTWVWASSGRWWRTGKPGMLQSMGWQSRTWLIDWTTTYTTHTHTASFSGSYPFSLTLNTWRSNGILDISLFVKYLSLYLYVSGIWECFMMCLPAQRGVIASHVGYFKLPILI